jgi:hypothetical protein
MVRGKSFYAIWDADKGFWSTDEYDVQRLVDEDMMAYMKKRAKEAEGGIFRVKYMSDFSTKAWENFRSYLRHISDNSKQLDETLTFANTKVTKRNYVSRQLPYALEKGSTEAYDKIMEKLYSPEERKKLEWAIGAIVAGDAKDIQKFIVLYGEAGSGKSTFLHIVQKLFVGYYTTFEAKALTSASNVFSTEVFRGNPLVAIQHDGDLSRIEDNTKLNSIISHEDMVMQEKYKPSYTARANCLLFMATNKPVKITDAKSGIIRRLIDVRPSGKRLPVTTYHNLMSRIDFELGAIAEKCLRVYQKMGKNYYSTYRPLGMILQTDIFFNFVENNYYTLLKEDGISLKRAWIMYKEWAEDALIPYRMPMHKFRDELKNYFGEFEPLVRIDGVQMRSYYSGFITDKFKDKEDVMEEPPPGWLVIDQTESLLDEEIAGHPAQYASEKYETPSKPWAKVKTVLRDLDTTKLHYVQLLDYHVVLDFDIRDEDGNKSAELNLEAASKFPPTYGEFSKSQQGIHLHYSYTGDVDELSRLYSEGIEVKVFRGDAALRRQLSRCNNIPITELGSGLPKKEKKMINVDAVKSEQGLRNLIKRNLKKEIHPGTKPSIDFIYKILQDAYEGDLSFDVRDMRNDVLVFAMNSTNQSDYCVKLVSKMKFRSDEISIDIGVYPDERIAFFDVEVFPNLFLVNWKWEGEENECIHMINPTAQEMEGLFKMKLVGFNNRRFDNHILYARFIGYDNERLHELSAKIVGGYKRSLFGEAYNISYADVYDFATKKQGLKKWQIELGIHHHELGFPFDEPIAEENWPLVIEYCDNDVKSTEAVFHHRKQDFVARQILADISGLTVNDTTQNHTAKIIFGDDPRPQAQFVYTDLSEMFPGYTFEAGKSNYRGEDPKEGGYVYSRPGFYRDVALLDIASMHPTSILCLNLFGPYTASYRELVDARLEIKEKNYEQARKRFNNKLSPHLEAVADAEGLAYALKIAINSVYGLTSANFNNKFKDHRNVDNIVAKRGALFMLDLKAAIRDQGKDVIHIKTDSVKLKKPTKKLVKFVIDFGKKYGYTFEEEAVYDRFLLVNDAVYVARYADSGEWTAVGAEFAHPYVFKTLFSKEQIEFEDLCETKGVTTTIYLDMNEGLDEDEHSYIFVGRAGSFVPIKPGAGGGVLLREKNDKYYAVSGSKGFRWMESEMVKSLGKEDDIDLEYYRILVDKAIKHVEKFVDLDILTK